MIVMREQLGTQCLGGNFSFAEAGVASTVVDPTVQLGAHLPSLVPFIPGNTSHT